MKTTHPGFSTHNARAASATAFLVALSRCKLAVLLLVTLSPVCGETGLAANTASDSSLSISPEQKGRLDIMKLKGPEASLAILPVMIAGIPFDQVTDVLGVLLEQQGLQHIELGRTPFTTGVKTEPQVLCVSLAAFLRTNTTAMDYVLYAEFNGPSLDEVRAVVSDKLGRIVWADRQTTQDKPLHDLGPTRDPMALIALLVERLRPQFSLNQDSANKRSHKLEDGLTTKRGYAPASEIEGQMPARLKGMKASRKKATLAVLGVRMDRTVDITNADDLAKRINETKLFKTATRAKAPVLLEATATDGDQLKYLWAIAREFQAYVKKNPPNADYVLYADYIFNRQHWEQGGVQFVVCDRQGEWVIAELTNSDQEDYRRVKPISAEGCDQLLVERLADRLR